MPIIPNTPAYAILVFDENLLHKIQPAYPTINIKSIGINASEKLGNAKILKIQHAMPKNT